MNEKLHVKIQLIETYFDTLKKYVYIPRSVNVVNEKELSERKKYAIDKIIYELQQMQRLIKDINHENIKKFSCFQCIKVSYFNFNYCIFNFFLCFYVVRHKILGAVRPWFFCYNNYRYRN